MAYVIQGILVSWRVRHIPGPPGVPLLGHVPFLLNAPWMTFAAWARTHGAGLYRVWVWNKLFVVVSDPAMVQEVFAAPPGTSLFPKDDWSYTFMACVGREGMGRGRERAHPSPHPPTPHALPPSRPPLSPLHAGPSWARVW